MASEKKIKEELVRRFFVTGDTPREMICEGLDIGSLSVVELVSHMLLLAYINGKTGIPPEKTKLDAAIEQIQGSRYTGEDTRGEFCIRTVQNEDVVDVYLVPTAKIQAFTRWKTSGKRFSELPPFVIKVTSRLFITAFRDSGIMKTMSEESEHTQEEECESCQG